nr:hypothetical protein [Longispora sp. (in: high G+C Gram-positive bacteria)]
MGSIPSTAVLTRRFAPQLGLAACLVAVSSFGAPAAFADTNAPGSTTVSPAGATIAATLAPGSKADFLVGTTTVSCSTSGSDGGMIPLAPLNRNEAGPISAPFSPPAYS